MSHSPFPAEARLHILHSMARSLSTSVDLNEILQIALQQVAELLQLETGWIVSIHLV